MSDETRQALTEAFELIEAEKLDEAQAVLKPMLTTHQDNPDVWWLYAHAVTDPDTARAALMNVRRLDPDYPNAAVLLEKLDDQEMGITRQAAGAVERPPAFLADAPPTLPDLPDDDEFDDEEPAEKAPRSRLLPLAILGIIAILVIAAIAVLTSQPRDAAAPTPTAETVAEMPTETPLPAFSADATPTLDSDIIAPDEPTPEPLDLSPEPTDAGFELTLEPDVTETVTAEETPPATNTPGIPDISSPEDAVVEAANAALDAYALAENGVGIESTTLGSTLLANVCTSAGAELRVTLPAVMDIIARQPIPDGINAIGARMINCDSDTVLLLIAVPVDDAQAYAEGNLSEESFQALWKPL